MERNDILISIIIPVYNREAFIGQAIESVLGQSVVDFELWVVDDGSKDRTSDIVQGYAQRDARVNYVYQENAGVSVARNAGLSRAGGKYVYFLDSDDALDSEFLRTSIDVIERSAADVVVVGQPYQDRLPHPTALPTCGQLWRHAFLKQNSTVRFPVGVQPGEDGLFSHCLLAMTDRIAANPAGIYYYGRHEGQNHLLINRDCESVLQQMDKWFTYLDDFYSRESLFERRALHLAKFLEHEPFELRYLLMPFNAEQKERVFQSVQDFYKRRVAPYLAKEEFDSLSGRFQLFLEASSAEDFDEQYEPYKNRINNSIKWKLKLLKLLPISSWRRKIRQQLWKKEIK